MEQQYSRFVLSDLFRTTHAAPIAPERNRSLGNELSLESEILGKRFAYRQIGQIVWATGVKTVAQTPIFRIFPA